VNAKVNRAWAAAKAGVVDPRTLAPTMLGALVSALRYYEPLADEALAPPNRVRWANRKDRELELVEVHLDIVAGADAADVVPAPPEEQPGLMRALRILRAARDESEPYSYRFEIYLEACARVGVRLALPAGSSREA
jgi:hypothetical protein